MNSILFLATRSLWHQRVRTALISAAVGLTVLLPVVVQRLVQRYESELRSRATDTPLVVGARGSRYDLVLGSLYFEGRVPKPASVAEVDWLRESGRGEPVPLFLGLRAEGHPVVGTTLDYYERRKLRAREGSLPALLGDAVLGAAVAEAEGVEAGGTILTDQGNPHDPAGDYPLRLNVVGVLEATGGPDDRAVFIDLPTAWVADGIGHGHDPADEQDEKAVMRRDEGAVVLDSSVMEFRRIDDSNRDSFHFHGEPGDLPVHGILLWPASDKGATILKGHYRVSDTMQVLEPEEVVSELAGYVFQLKLFFDANTAVVGAATALFLVVIVVLSIQVRRRERETLHRIGCARGTVVQLMAAEVLMTVVAGALAAGMGAWVLAAWLWGLVGV